MTRRTAIARCLCAFALAAGLVLAGAVPAAAAGSDRRVWAADFPDPDVVWTGTGYVALSTASQGHNMPALTSPDLVHWKRTSDALPRLPAWSAPGRSWAPALWRRGREWVLYYATRDRVTNQQCLSVATATRAQGPYLDRTTKPWLCQHRLGGSIDPSPYLDGAGRAYLIWKSDGNAVHQRSTLWSQRLTPDGLRRLGSAVPMLREDAAWQSPTLEGPSVVSLAGGRFLLLYSAGRWSSAHYAIGYADCAGPAGPCHDVDTRAPWQATTKSRSGPGGASAFQDAHGHWYLAFHAWSPGRVGYPRGARSLWIQPLHLGGLT